MIAETIGSNEPRPEAKYSYNWPYDFFSLVELAKIDVGVQLGGEVPVTPPDMTISPALVDAKESVKQGGPALKTGFTKTMVDVERDMIPQGQGIAEKNKTEILIDILNKDT